MKKDKKKTKQETSDVILLDLYDLVLNPDIPDNERVILLSAKNKMEQKIYFPKVMNDLEFQLRPFAIKSQLSKPVAVLYMKISTIGKFEKELGKGLAATTITFGNIL